MSAVAARANKSHAAAAFGSSRTIGSAQDWQCHRRGTTDWALWHLCDTKLGSAVLSRLHNDLYILSQRDQKTHETFDRVPSELTGQHS